MNNYVTYDDLREISNRIVSSGKDVDVVLPLLVITSDFADCDITVTLGDTTLTASYDGVDYRVTLQSYGDYTVTCSKEIDGVMRSNSGVVSISVVQIYEMRINPVPIYGYRIKKSEPNPYASVEYIYDAVGMKPAKMNFSTGVFDYGDWKDVWFVADNKPCMLKYDGTVDYYLDPDDYTLRDDGVTPSDVADTAYEGNAMSEIPLVWVKRYEDGDYEYELVSQYQINDSYKAYAHTRADSSIADYFYWNCFRPCVISSKLRSIKGTTYVNNIAVATLRTYANNNGSSSYDLPSYTQSYLLVTLSCLMFKSVSAHSALSTGVINTFSNSVGILYNKGQFFGQSAFNTHMKLFHIEDFYGGAWVTCLGILLSSNKYYVKLTPEGTGYSIDNISGYLDTGVTALASPTDGWWNNGTMSEIGLLPTSLSGSSSTYYAARGYIPNRAFSSPAMGAVGGSNDSFNANLFTFAIDFPASSLKRQLNGAFLVYT